ncbi:2-hydroxy-3-oxopropionate reductase [Gracilibacillus boraciitolerans JCM 21714]|uniref:2-hydroxy-3-oxopropionate reductase n=2 Tax=Gracilibacillus boraciitolerans TaxID=307521 RepID=W4VPW2_9BACI|nr:2-hydroxy-3-oxopropionate reductase [Gracilibacillus boraciitolerans JCM 21714]
MKIGFIGLGIMGKPMAFNLLKNNFELKAFDLNENARKEVVEKGGMEVFSSQEATEGSDVLITMLPTSGIIENVLFGKDGVSKSLKKDAVVINMSSVSPVESVKWAERLNENGVEYLDAPVSGGEPKAIDGTLAIMVGGKEEVFNKTLPILEAMGEEITLVGGIGSGSTTKLANQILVNVTIAAIGEAVVLASKAGVDIEKMYQAIRGGLAGSTVLDAKMPLIIERNFKPGGRIEINLKDLLNVQATGRELQTPLPLTTNVIEMFQSLKAHGKQTDDHSGLIQYYEQVANYQVPKGGSK